MQPPYQAFGGDTGSEAQIILAFLHWRANEQLKIEKTLQDNLLLFQAPRQSFSYALKNKL